MALVKGTSPKILSLGRQYVNNASRYISIYNNLWMLKAAKHCSEGRSSILLTSCMQRHVRSCQFPRAFSSDLDKNRNYTDDSTKVLYDGECKICALEISGLKRFTRHSDHVKFIDISSVDYDPDLYGGVTYEQAMKEMHVVGPKNQIYTQGDAIRQMYHACGLSWIARLTELPSVKEFCDRLYIKFAEYRLRKALDRCDDGSCSIKLKHLKDKLKKDEI